MALTAAPGGAAAAPAPQAAPLPARALAAFLRRYPFGRGQGRILASAPVRAILGAAAGPVWARAGGRPCLVPLDDHVGRMLFLFGDFDPWVGRVLEACLEPGDVALDIGANLGAMTLAMAARVGPAGRVLAVEPSPAVLPFLRQTLAQNAELPVTLVDVALGRAEGTLRLALEPGNLGRAHLIPPGAAAGGEVHPVRVRRLAGLLREEGITQVAAAKIDVEGSEAEVLAGLLGAEPPAPLPEAILLEEHDPAGSRAFALLREGGYALHGIEKRLIGRPRLLPEGTAGFLRARDFLAIRAGARAALRRRLGLPPEDRPPTEARKG